MYHSSYHGSQEGYCRGHSKKNQNWKSIQGSELYTILARSTEQQKFDSNVIKEMKENLDNKNIPLFRVVRNSVPPDAWCETKFGSLPLFSPLAYQWLTGFNRNCPISQTPTFSTGDS